MLDSVMLVPVGDTPAWCAVQHFAVFGKHSLHRMLIMRHVICTGVHHGQLADQSLNFS